MKTRLHLSILFVLLATHSVFSAIETSASKSGAHKQLKALDDLYIDDEGDDDIQLQDHSSGSGNTHIQKVHLSQPTEDDYEFEDEDDIDEAEDEYPFDVDEVEEKETEIKADEREKETKVEEKEKEKEKDIQVEEKEKEIMVDENENNYKVEVVTPRVSPVAISPPYDDFDKDDHVAHSGSGHGSVPTDDEDSEEEEEGEEDDDYDGEDMDYTSITGVETDPQVFDDLDDVKRVNAEVIVPTPPPSTDAPLPPPPEFPPTVVEHNPPVDAPPKHNVPEDPIHTTDRDNHRMNGTSVGIAKTGDRQASFFAQPGILAAVIGGAVVGLLCAILLVMFIVYRMRKKDEGSYALEEPKRNSPNSHPYNKNSREFYA